MFSTRTTLHVWFAWHYCCRVPHGAQRVMPFLSPAGGMVGAGSDGLAPVGAGVRSVGGGDNWVNVAGSTQRTACRAAMAWTLPGLAPPADESAVRWAKSASSV